MKKYIPLLALFISLPAMAGSGLLDMGKNLLQSNTGKYNTSDLSNSKIVDGLKEALRVGTQKAVATVGRSGGFMNDQHVHIPLPGPLAKAKSGLSMIGAEGMADDLEKRMNQAAETAAPKAASIFGDAVTHMSITDARKILNGPSNAATQYFKGTTSPELRAAMKPIVEKSLANVGALQAYNNVTAKVKSLPFASSVNLDFNDYVVGKTLDGLFYYLAKQEAEIRANPAARTTDLLRAVFK